MPAKLSNADTGGRRTPRPRPSTDQILAAAERVFARQGFGETSLRQLIGEAGISTTAFYARFASKEAVLEALVERLLGSLGAAASKLAESRTPEHLIASTVEILVSTLGQHREVVAIALGEGSSVASVRQALSSSYQALVRLIASMAEGEAEEREALAWAFVGALQLQVSRWAVLRDIDEQGLQAALHAVSESLLKAVLARRTEHA